MEIQTVRSSDTGLYKCEASNIGGRRTSVEGRLTVAGQISSSSKPEFLRRPKDQVANAGDVALLECAVTATSSPLVWLKDGRPLTLSSAAGRLSRIGQGTLLLSPVRASDAGSYVCRAHSSSSVDSPPAVLRVRTPAALSPGGGPASLVSKETMDVEFSCPAEGDPSPSVRWFKNGELITPSEYFVVRFVCPFFPICLFTR